VNGALTEAFRAHAWATRTLLELCGQVGAEELDARHDATGWTVTQTLTHLVSADGYYVATLTGTVRPVPRWNDEADPPWSVDLLRSSAERVAALWAAYLATADDADRLVVLDEGTFECRAGVIVAHALHHGDLHREQVCTILRSVGLEPPDLQPWEYALDSGRARFLEGA
jgi:uncharacterized damage-inducible protein DinB